MIDVTILAMTENPTWLEFFWTESRSVQGSRLVVTGSMEEACDLLNCTDARLIVVDWQDATVSSEQMDQLLWANSILAHPASGAGRRRELPGGSCPVALPDGRR